MAVFEDPSVSQPKERNLDYDESIQCLTRRFVLLAFCPLGDEEDLGAQSLLDLIADTLSNFNRPHHFQLAVNDFLANEETLLARIHALMKHLRTIKCRAALQKVTPLAPVMRNVTRWSSVFSMVKRYNKLHPALLAMDHASIAKHDIARFLLTEEESTQAKERLETLFDFQEVSKALQDPTLTMVGVRRAFDWVVRQYPSMTERLASDAAVVNYPVLETGITKIISGGRLTTREQEACKGFKSATAASPTEKATRLFWAPVFQKAKMVYTDMRKSMDVNTLDVLMFLAYNRDSAFELARHGGDVVLACRNPERSAAAAEAIREEMKADPGHGQIEEITLDTSLQSSVKTFSDEFLKHHQKLDILVNNAGCMGFPYKESVDGFELMVATNHLSPFTVTASLVDGLKRSSSARVVAVSSGMHHSAKQSPGQLFMPENKHSETTVYGNSNVFFAFELGRRLESAGISNITSVACHPGAIDSMGTLPTLYAAVAPEVKMGMSGAIAGMRGYPAADVRTTTENLRGFKFKVE
ncbi:hypothetical protein JG688_00017584 [Phytophthora aleatoria]|uniref:Uncharacterized protein n=1 Tax=Phytophthora aleatoria TaxID=2496075 RepID=A0A8J5IDJ9_9STRA|nr:hypothetical protein JG688_00017584 [Phytophthora aleatoria]